MIAGTQNGAGAAPPAALGDGGPLVCVVIRLNQFPKATGISIGVTAMPLGAR